MRFEHARHALIQSLMVLVGELVVPVCAFRYMLRLKLKCCISVWSSSCSCCPVTWASSASAASVGASCSDIVAAPIIVVLLDSGEEGLHAPDPEVTLKFLAQEVLSIREEGVREAQTKCSYPLSSWLGWNFSSSTALRGSTCAHIWVGNNIKVLHLLSAFKELELHSRQAKRQVHARQLRWILYWRFQGSACCLSVRCSCKKRLWRRWKR